MTDPQIPDDIDNLIEKLKTSNEQGYPEALKAKVSAVLSKQFTDALKQLRGSIGSFETNIGGRLRELNQELGETRREFRQSSEAANRHALALIVATVALVLATLFLAGIGYLQFQAMEKETQSHIEPEISLEIVNEDDGKVIISNDGLHPLLDVRVDTDTALFLGPPPQQVRAKYKDGEENPRKR